LKNCTWYMGDMGLGIVQFFCLLIRSRWASTFNLQIYFDNNWEVLFEIICRSHLIEKIKSLITMFSIFISMHVCFSFFLFLEIIVFLFVHIYGIARRLHKIYILEQQPSTYKRIDEEVTHIFWLSFFTLKAITNLHSALSSRHLNIVINYWTSTSFHC